MTRRILLVAALVAAAVVAYLAVNRLTTTDEERVREVIEGVISDLENDNIGSALLGIRDALSDSYRHRHERGDVTVDKQVAVRFVTTLKQRFVDFEVDVRKMSVSVSGDTAKVTLTGRVTAAKKGKPGERIEVLTQPGHNGALLHLAKENRGWLITGSEQLRRDLD